MQLLEETHRSKFNIHPGTTKMYRDLRQNYWWRGMKRDIAEFVSKCLICQQVKIEHRVPAGKLQRISIPEWKWEQVTMDFVTGLPKTVKGYDGIWVIVDRLTKSAHFLPINKKYSLDKLASLYIKEIIRYHGVPVSIISDRDPRFTSKFWGSLQKSLGTQLKFSTAFHPQTDGQSERTIQTLEDLLRACALDFGGSWDMHLHLIKFFYNNSYHSSIQMAPFEALYGRKCRSPVYWDEVGERKLLGPQLIQKDADNIRIIRQRLLTAQSRQKSYADRRRRDLEFEIGEHVFLKVSPTKGVMRFGQRGKLAPRFIGPFEILQKVGPVAYKLAFPPTLASIHDVFHVSMLRRYIRDPSHVISYQPLQLRDDATFREQPTQILERKEHVLRNKITPLVKICWQHHSDQEATWEREEDMQEQYPHLFY